MHTAADTTHRSLLFIGNKAALPFSTEAAEAHGFQLIVVSTNEAIDLIKRQADADADASEDVAVLVSTSVEFPIAAASQLRGSHPTAVVALLCKEAESFRYRQAVILSPALRGVVTFVLEDGAPAILEQMDALVLRSNNARRLESVLGHINRELDAWSAEKELDAERVAASGQYLDALLSSAPDAIIATDNEGAVLAWNDAATRLYGYSPFEISGKHISLIFADEESKNVEELLQEVRSGGIANNRPFQCERSDGGRWPGEITVAPVKGEKERIIGISFLCRDITDRIVIEREREALLQNERALRESAEKTAGRLRFLTNAGTILSSSLDYETTLRRVAEVAVPEVGDWCVVDMLEGDHRINRLALSHRDPAKIQLVNELSQRYPPSAEPGTPIRQVVDTREPFFIGEVTDEMMVEGTEDEYHLDVMRRLAPKSIMIAPLVVKDEAIGVVTLAMAESDRRYEERDISFIREISRRASMAIENALLYRETRLLNAELERRVEERTAALKAANKELEMFSYSVSHDLRTPLRAIEGFARILSEDYAHRLDDEGQRLLHIVRSNAVRMGTLISDLLEFARMNRTHVSRSHVDIKALAEDIYAELIAEEKDRDGKIELRVPPLPKAWADQVLIRQAFQNLLANAVKFTRPRRHAVIEVTARERAEQVIYEVKDNGVGFDMEYANKLFKVFQRLHSPRDFEGTGIGLAIVDRIVRAHGGKVWANSREGEGTTISLSLPKNERVNENLM